MEAIFAPLRLKFVRQATILSARKQLAFENFAEWNRYARLQDITIISSWIRGIFIIQGYETLITISPHPCHLSYHLITLLPFS